MIPEWRCPLCSYETIVPITHLLYHHYDYFGTTKNNKKGIVCPGCQELCASAWVQNCRNSDTFEEENQHFHSCQAMHRLLAGILLAKVAS
jgi:hypothetical protein